MNDHISPDPPAESVGSPTKSPLMPERSASTNDMPLSPMPNSSNHLEPDASPTSLNGSRPRIKERWVVNPKFIAVQDQNSQD